MKVLVCAEDQCFADQVAELANQNLGYRALPVYNFVEALEHGRYMRFDAALVSSSLMRNLIWQALCEDLKDFMPRCRIVLLVPKSDEDSIVETAAIFAKLVVPFDRCQLLQSLRKIEQEIVLDPLREALEIVRQQQEQLQRTRRPRKARKATP
jgi:hypothetical protein